jgi:TRAP-type C4-dicarboxylate transport system substrate-binding protein
MPIALSVQSESPALAQDLQPVGLRIASDHSPVPHPAALAQVHFAKRLPEVIPGSELRTYHAGALYTIPEAVEALTAGDLEMAWSQFGKSVPVDPWMAVPVGPMMLTTPGAVEQIDSFETTKMLFERLEKHHDIKAFGTAHLSFFLGAGARQRLRSPEDFKGKKIRSFGPVENAALEAWGASPVVMAFGDVPPALQTGVIDGLLTSIDGFVSTRDQAPFYTIAGINGISADYYWVGASKKWWDNLNEPTQKALENVSSTVPVLWVNSISITATPPPARTAACRCTGR